MTFAAYFARQLALAMEDAGMRQTDLHEVTGISHAHISKLCRGMSEPSLPMIRRVARAFDCAIEDFLPLPEEMEGCR